MKKLNSISFVIPCLNEEMTLPYVLEKLVKLKKEDLKNYQVEILISDNGSTDRSREIGLSYGARVEPCEVRGYGAALDSGIRKAKGEIIIFADADDTYDFLESPKLIEELEKGYEFVIGSRLDGTIHKGAMPFLHRYLGTPVINWIINLLYAKETKVRDSNSGFRCFLKSSYLKWDIRSTGMEFASELLIKSLIHGAKTSNVPVSLYPDKPGRIPHLKTWRDGMRHLLRILLYSPNLFQRVGLTITGIFLIFLISGYILGIKTVMGVNIFGLHSLLLSAFFAILGQCIWGVGLFLASRSNSSTGSYRILLELEEDSLFFMLVGLSLISLIGILILILVWARMDFQFLNLEKEVLVGMTLLLLIIQTIVYSLAAHIMKRAE
jgi:glycosyltransferase involved in cell wall biosynthesis